jgi:hypothetical protein
MFYCIFFYLMDTFAPKHLVRVRAGDDMCGVRNWLDNRVRLAISERNYSFNVWNSNVNMIRGNHRLVDYIANVDMRMERKWWRESTLKYSVKLDPGLPPRKLYDNLLRLGVINGPERFNGNVDVEWLSNFFLTRLALSTEIDFDVPVYTFVPELIFVSVTENEVVCNAVMSIKSIAAGVDEIPLSFIKSLCLFCWIRWLTFSMTYLLVWNFRQGGGPLKYLKNNKAASADSIAAELLKNDGPNLVDALHAVIQQAWTSETLLRS